MDGSSGQGREEGRRINTEQDLAQFRDFVLDVLFLVECSLWPVSDIFTRMPT